MLLLLYWMRHLGYLASSVTVVTKPAHVQQPPLWGGALKAGLQHCREEGGGAFFFQNSRLQIQCNSYKNFPWQGPQRTSHFYGQVLYLAFTKKWCLMVCCENQHLFICMNLLMWKAKLCPSFLTFSSLITSIYNVDAAVWTRNCQHQKWWTEPVKVFSFRT